MNCRTFNRLVEISKALKPLKSSGRAFHVTGAVKKGRIVCIGINNYHRHHKSHVYGRYYNYKFTNEYRASLHSEISLLTKLGEEDLSDYEICNVRIGNDGKIRMSKPCKNCLRVLTEQFTPKNVFYSNDSGEMEKLDN